MKKKQKKNQKVTVKKKSQKKTAVKKAVKLKVKTSSKKSASKNKKPTAGKKTSRPKIKKLSRSPKKTPIITNKQIEKDLLSFDLSSEEISQLLSYHESNSEAENQALDQTNGFREELSKLIKNNDPVISSKKIKTTNLTINQIQEHHQHSPFVLNLQKMAQEKKEKELKKQFVEHRYRQISHSINKLRKPLRFPTVAQRVATPITIEEPASQEKQARSLYLTLQEVEEQFTKKPFFRLPTAWLKPAMAFAVLAMLVILPIKGFTYVKDLNASKHNVMTNAETAIAQLKSAGTSVLNADFKTATTEFSQAEMSFNNARQELNSINTFLSTTIKIIPVGGKYFTDAERLTQAGAQISQLGDLMATAYKNLNEEKNLTITEKISALQITMRESLLPKIQEINKNLRHIDSAIIPENYRGIFEDMQQSLDRLEQNFSEFESFSNSLLDILGHNYKRRYLILFQNNNELRATGGFIGSLAMVDIQAGNIEKIDIPGGGSYDFQGSLTKLVQAPDPLQLINSRWELQDSNWFFDFPTSAKKIQWFFEDASKTSVDGIIAINADLMTKILSHTEPISMPQYNKTITADNFLRETQLAVEYEYDKQANKPKQFIADLTPILLEQIFNPEKTDLLGIIGELQTGLKQKNIQVYFNNENIQSQMASLGWAGEIKNPPLDYLAIVNTNIAGGKTDSFIKQNIEHTVQINDQGTVYGRIEITRQHNGDPNDIFSGVRNVNYLRVYVPQGATLLSAEGFNPPSLELFEVPEDYLAIDETIKQQEMEKTFAPETNTTIYKSNNKTVFAGWTQTDPGQESIVTITYQLPFKFSFNEDKSWLNFLGQEHSSQLYSIYYQKQSGSNNTTITSKITLPEKLKTVWSYPSKLGTNNEAKFELQSDAIHGIVVSNK